MTRLTSANNAADLSAHFRGMLALQRWCPGDAGHGALINPTLDLPDPSAGYTPNMLAAFMLLWAAQEKRAPGGDSFLRSQIGRMEAAADYLLRAQRDSGCIDGPTCNFDSAPDTAFSVVPIAMGCFHLAEIRFPPELEPLRDKLEAFMRKASHGLVHGGIHTPNHRWVVASALALLQKLHPDIDARPTIDAYLAETIDIDEEGFFLERSAGAYDSICNRSLFLIDACLDYPAAREAALRNLRLDLKLLNADGSIETGLSHRQDFGASVVPASLAACYLRAFAITAETAFLAAARSIYAGAKAAPPNPEAAVPAVWLAHEFLVGVPDPASEVARDEHLLKGTLHLPGAGYWKVGKPSFTAACFRGRSHLLAFRTGRAELASLQIAQAYLGQGQFLSDELIPEETGVRLRYKGRRPGRSVPGYRKPLGRPVAVDQWSAMDAERVNIPMAPAGGELVIKPEEQGLSLEYLPDEILPGVPGQLSFDFAPGGIWECDGARIKPQPGQVLFLTKGFGRMTYGTDTIEIGPGHYGHGAWTMRDAQGQGNCVRVLVTFLSPHAHRFTIRGSSSRHTAHP